jgi:cation diffusion facilitator family transporter
MIRQLLAIESNTLRYQLAAPSSCAVSISPPRDEAAIAVREGVYRDAGRAAVWGLGVNLALATVKVIVGFLSGSAALIADAVNSIGDVASSLVVRGALWIAQQDEDEDHPYGHTKAESIAGLSVSLVVVGSAALLAIETLRRIPAGWALPGLAAPITAALCAVVKESLYRYTQRVARRIDSAALRATSWDHRSDALGSAAIALALVVAPWLGPAGTLVDPIAALIVCAVLIAIGGRLFARTARELMDQQADTELVDQIRQVALAWQPVRDVEKLRVRKSGLEYFVEIHIQVDGQLTVDQGHRIAHEVKDRLLGTFPRIRDVLVHIEPHQP